ncbi:hypothetical protein [Salinarchaeum sp. Harcht-Bsk1]|uniref:hypothetical protein n=1 Tax=Salinarchaeum sp. Harcht-Bsk1 TaxID=1333523 RepID=UPI00165183B1|nr:hypothetical protein [Salinarchaeum sp. Harcht-Bsk1]
MDIAERTSWYKQRRAQAYAFPLEALEQGDAIGAAGESPAGSDGPSTGVGDGEEQQGLGTVGEPAVESGQDGVKQLGSGRRYGRPMRMVARKAEGDSFKG